ncbi:MAG TPA: NUDIX hydrolase [Jatrophihabitans sp.]|uniref:NUDIX domain-containing protein n=1 Tax=Jatrophihabitans sp. TaxID=1932789 RepID=UPI002EE24A64
MTFTVQFAQKALIVRDGCVLLIQKGPGDVHNPYRWEVPGGRLKSAESLDDHLKREVLEEVGLHVWVGIPLSMWSWRLGAAVDSPTVVAVLRLCVPLAGTPTSSNQDETDFISSWEWTPAEKVAQYDLIPNARKAILDAIQVIPESLALNHRISDL